MKLEFTTEKKDIERLTRWISCDPHHKGQDAKWWFTGADTSLLCFCFYDDEGPVAYVRIDKEKDFCRLHTQFAPRDEVSKFRLIKAMLRCIPIIEKFCMQHGKGIIFQSNSELLISFMIKKFNFKSVSNSDYKLLFQEG